MAKFKQKTIFILGAGASVDSGYPTGEGLNEIIESRTKEYNTNSLSPQEISDFKQLIHANSGNIDFLKHYGNNGFIYEACLALGKRHNINTENIREFHAHFVGTKAPSIDEFLRRHQKNSFDLIGNYFVSQAILRAENLDKLNQKSNWYHALWNSIWEDSEINLISNFENIAFITFNYDRSLETYFFLRLKHYFQGDEQKAEEFMENNLKIIHVYGKIGTYKERIGKVKLDGYVDYGSIKSFEDFHCWNIYSAFEKLRIVGTRFDQEIEKDITSIIRNNEKIVFLGFGFNRTNVELLNLETKSIQGTILGLKRTDIDYIKDIFPNSPNLRSTHAKAFLEEYFSY